MTAELFLGLISGTSADGVDAALVEFGPQIRLHAAWTFAYPPELREEVLEISQTGGAVALDALGALDARVGEHFAAAALALLERASVRASQVCAIGSHGQTLRHQPGAEHPFTLQIGDPHRIAERTGISTVCDFRRRDVAAGGQGAPLVPAFHAALFADPGENRAVLNLGGIGNLTLLPHAGPVRGFDTGPANGLMDAWCLLQRGQACDLNGAWAASGSVSATLLDRLLADPFFALPPPKSTGRDQFHLDWLARHMPGTELAAADVQATLLELSARSVADALRRWQPATTRVMACGGGVHNASLMRALARLLAPASLETTAAAGLDPDFVEAAAFAWLARETLAGRPGNLPSATGAAAARVLGAIIPA